MRRSGLGQRNRYLMGSLAWLAVGAGLWWGVCGAILAFAEEGLSEDIDEVIQGALPYERIKAIVERQLRAMTGGGG